MSAIVEEFLQKKLEREQAKVAMLVATLERYANVQNWESKPDRPFEHLIWKGYSWNDAAWDGWGIAQEALDRLGRMEGRDNER